MNHPPPLLPGWTWNPAIILIGIGILAIYLSVFRINRQTAWFVAAVAVLLLSLLSPLNTLAAGYLFSAHMAQHILLLLIVPALLLLGIPASHSDSRWPRILRYPAVGWLAGVGAMWFWHIPFLCNAAVTSPLVRIIQIGSLLALGSLFWWQILAPCENARLSPPGAVLYLLSACITCSILGIIITFSPVAVCSIYTMPRADALLHTIRTAWGISPERDQQIGGLLMWLPMCLIYLGAICLQIVRWFGQPATPEASKVS